VAELKVNGKITQGNIIPDQKAGQEVTIEVILG
jgi:hypothetical protein